MATILLGLLLVSCGNSTSEVEEAPPEKQTLPPETEEMRLAPATPPPNNLVGTILRFHEDGGSDRYRVSGWGKSEARFAWTEGQSAKLNLPISRRRGKLRLRVKAYGNTKQPELRFQPVDVFVNGRKIASWEVGSEIDNYTAEIPEDLADTGERLNIEFRTPKAAPPPVKGGEEPENRLVGIAVHEVEVRR